MDQDGASARVAAPATTAEEEAVLQIVREVLGRPGIGLGDDLFDHGATSLSFVRVLAEVQRRLHVTVPVAALVEVTARSLARHVAAEALATVGV